MASRRPLLARAADALLALAGAREDAAPASGEPRRLLSAPVETPEEPGTALTRATAGNGLDWMNGATGANYAGAAQVRTANPQEYKRTGATVRVKGFNEHPVVSACIRVIVDQVAQIPWVVKSGPGVEAKTVGSTHPLQRLLDFPNPRWTARQMRARAALDVIGYGNGLFRLDRFGRRLPQQVRPLNVEGVQTVWVDVNGDPAQWDVSDWNGLVLNIRNEDVVHFKDLDMPKPYFPDVFGYPRGAAALQSIVADLEATGYVRQTVGNDGTPTLAIIGSDHLTQADAIAMQERYVERTVNRGNRGKPAVFAGVKDLKAIGFTLHDLEFPDLRRVSREDICAAFGVDPRMIGIASASNDGGLSGAQYQEARSRLIQHTVEPLLALIVDELNASLAPEFGNVVIDYDRDVLRDLVEDDKATSERIRAELQVPGLLSLEEARVALRRKATPEPTDTLLVTLGTQLIPAAAAVLDPTAFAQAKDAAEMDGAGDGAGDEGDEPTDLDPATGKPRPKAVAGGVATGDASVQDTALNGAQVTALLQIVEQVQLGVIPVSSAKAVIIAAFPMLSESEVNAIVADLEEGSAAPVPEPTAPVEQKERWFRALLPRRTRRALRTNADPRYDHWLRQVKLLDADEVRYAAQARVQFGVERRSVTATFTDAAAASGRALADGERVRGINDPDLQRATSRVVAGYLPGGEYHEEWRKRFEALIRRTYTAGNAADVVGTASLDFRLPNEYVERAVLARAERLATYVGETTAKQIVAVVQSAERAGLSIADTAKLIQQAVFGGHMTDTRARTIARTESAGAMSQGQWDQAEASGVYQSKEWLAFDDNETRPSHRAAHGQGRIAMREAFAATGMQFPMEPGAPAGEVINCRCRPIFYVEPPGEPVL